MSKYKWEKSLVFPNVYDFAAGVNEVYVGYCTKEDGRWVSKLYLKIHAPAFDTLLEAKAALIAAYEESKK